jgi:hypothetical protein
VSDVGTCRPCGLFYSVFGLTAITSEPLELDTYSLVQRWTAHIFTYKHGGNAKKLRGCKFNL